MGAFTSIQTDRVIYILYFSQSDSQQETDKDKQTDNRVESGSDWFAHIFEVARDALGLLHDFVVDGVHPLRHLEDTHRERERDRRRESQRDRDRQTEKQIEKRKVKPSNQKLWSI